MSNLLSALLRSMEGSNVHVAGLFILLLSALASGQELPRTRAAVRRLLQETSSAHKIEVALQACHAFAQTGTCSTHSFSDLDHSLKDSGGMAGFHTYLKVHETPDQQIKFELSPSCYKQPAADFRIGQAHHKLSLAPVPSEVNCSQTPGIWFLAADQQHRQQSIFEDLLTTLFPLYLMSKVACRTVFQDIMITHGEMSFLERWMLLIEASLAILHLCGTCRSINARQERICISNSASTSLRSRKAWYVTTLVTAYVSRSKGLTLGCRTCSKAC